MARYVIVSFESLTANSAGGIGKIGYGLSAYLHQQGEAVHFYTINKGPHQTPFPSSSVHWLTRYPLFIINLLSRKGIIDTNRQRNLEELMFDFFLSFKRLRGDYLISTCAYLDRTLRRHKKHFRSVSLIPTNPNEEVIYSIYHQELQKYNATGYTDAYYDPYRVGQFRKGVRHFDQILSISPVTAASYGHTGKPVREIPYIYIPGRQVPAGALALRKEGSLVFFYVAHTVPLKGLHRMLDEWKKAALPDAELHIAGSIHESYRKAFALELESVPGVRYLGRPESLTPALSNAHAVVIPSLLDNEPTTAIEALQHHRPVLISDRCGYAGFIGDFAPEAVFDIMEEGALAALFRRVATNPGAFNGQFADAYEYIATAQFDMNHFHEQILEAAATHTTKPEVHVPAARWALPGTGGKLKLPVTQSL